jgi:vacuolar-type H+-ATPase subunit E/Vma4
MLHEDLATALVPVREALLVAARAEAARVLARADEAAARLLGDAHAQAEQLLGQARAQGAADAAALVAARRSQAGRQARALVLEARRAEYAALREAARAAVSSLRDEPDYPALRSRMVTVLCGLVGADASVRDAAGGGVIATAPGRCADLSLSRLADRAVDAVLADPEEVGR